MCSPFYTFAAIPVFPRPNVSDTPINPINSPLQFNGTGKYWDLDSEICLGNNINVLYYFRQFLKKSNNFTLVHCMLSVHVLYLVYQTFTIVLLSCSLVLGLETCLLLSEVVLICYLLDTGIAPCTYEHLPHWTKGTEGYSLIHYVLVSTLQMCKVAM